MMPVIAKFITISKVVGSNYNVEQLTKWLTNKALDNTLCVVYQVAEQTIERSVMYVWFTRSQAVCKVSYIYSSLCPKFSKQKHSITDFNNHPFNWSYLCVSNVLSMKL